MVIVGIAFGCVVGDFQMPSWRFELLVPILGVELVITDMVLRYSSFKTGSSGLISFEYKQSDTLASLEELFPINDISTNFSTPGILGSQPDFTDKKNYLLSS